MAPSSTATTTSVQVALRIRPTTAQDAISIPARFQRTVIHPISATTVSVDASSTPNATGGPASPAPATGAAANAKKQIFSFDQVHAPATTQHALYTATAEPLISSFLEGFNCTVLAYGQTSSGKTYSMTGIDLDADPTDPNNGMGIIPRSVSAIFSKAKAQKEDRNGTWSFAIKASFIEIYNEDLIDLFVVEDASGGRREVQIREDKDGTIIWNGLREVPVRSAAEVMNLLRQGTALRRTNETEMNAQSSRSHAIFSLTLTQKKYTGAAPIQRSNSPLPTPGARPPSRLVRPGSIAMHSPSSGGGRISSPTFGRPPTPSFASAMSRSSMALRPGSAMGQHGRAGSPTEEDERSGDWVTITSKFHFVDLAGSERLKRTAAAGERIKEGISINSGLLALGNVISALGDPARAKHISHIPYRDSKLTRLLQDSLGGNAHTLMIACVSPAEWNAGETVNTLKYANRARNIKNRAEVKEREEGWDDIEWLQNMVIRLRKDLKALREGGASSVTSPNSGVSELPEVEGAGKKVLAQFVALQGNYEELREKFTERTEELTRLRRELGEARRGSGGSVGGMSKYEEIVGPVIEEYEKTISAMEAELNLNKTALRHTNDMVTEREDELSSIRERYSATELYVEELRSRVSKLTEREASTESYIRDLEDKIRSYDDSNLSSSESVADLKREIQRYRDAEMNSTAYIAELEGRLARSDESVLQLRKAVERLEQDVEERSQTARSLHNRMEALTRDAGGWRTDLEEREARVAELESQMKEWEERRREFSDSRSRLGSVAGSVERARQTLLEDLRTAGGLPRSEGDASEDTSFALSVNGGALTPDATALHEELLALQQTHAATLADLSSVSVKYRDALREIHDLSTQIAEMRLSGHDSVRSVSPISGGIGTPGEPSELGLAHRPLTFRQKSTARDRHTVDAGQMNSAGRRLFFRQAASAESLHARSRSQSQSLSQDFSSTRLHRPSLSNVSSNGHSLSYMNGGALLSPPFPPPRLALPPIPSVNERSVASLEKEVMRLQEVLKEREAEISMLEASLKAKAKNGVVTPDESLESRDATATPESDPDAKPNSAELSPKTLNNLVQLRKVVAGEPLEDGSESGVEPLDRFNELMRSMAHKESQHREAVDSLNEQLSQVRRQHDDLVALSRDQQHNMATELEGLRSQMGKADERNIELSAEIAKLQEREADLIAALDEQARAMNKLRDEHEVAMKAHAEEAAATITLLREEHEHLLKSKSQGVDDILTKAKEEHGISLGKLHTELAAAAASLAKTHEDHQAAFGRLRQEHEDELRKRAADAEATLQRLRSEHERAITRLKSDHTTDLDHRAADAAAQMQRMREEHAAELKRAEITREGAMSESETQQAEAVRQLEEEHAATIARKTKAFEEDMENLKAEHARLLARKQEDFDAALSSKEKDHAEAMESIKDEHARTISHKDEDLHAAMERLKAEHESVVAMLNDNAAVDLRLASEELSKSRQQHAALVKDRDAVETAFDEYRNMHAAILEEMEAGQLGALDELRTAHEAALASLKQEHESRIVDLEVARTEELSRMAASHQESLAKAQAIHDASLQALTDQHNAEREMMHTEHSAKLAKALADRDEQHGLERGKLVEEARVLSQELDQHKATIEASTAEHAQLQALHETAQAEHIRALSAVQKKLTGAEDQRMLYEKEFEALRAELEQSKAEAVKLAQEAAQREPLTQELEEYRSVLGELQTELQRTKDDMDNMRSEKHMADKLIVDLQEQLSGARPVEPMSSQSIRRANGITASKLPALATRSIPPPSAPPGMPLPPPPPSVDSSSSVTHSSTTRTSMSSNTSSSQGHGRNGNATPTTNGDAKLGTLVEDKNKLIEEQEAMIKTLNKQLTHCEGDLQAHMDLVATLETSLNDSEKNLRKSRLTATELAKERDSLNSQVEALRAELQEAKREVINVRKSIVEEKLSLEHRLDEERRAKERARAQLDSRMEELQKRKSKFACM